MSTIILFDYESDLLSVSSMKKTQGLDADQITFTMGWLSTVPAQVMRGLLSVVVLCSLMLPSSDPTSRNGSSYGQKARLAQLEAVSVNKTIFSCQVRSQGSLYQSQI